MNHYGILREGASARLRFWTIMGWAIGSLGLWASSPIKPFSPHPEDFTLLWWADGPERFAGMKTPPAEALLCLQSGTLGLALDVRGLRLRHAGRFSKPLDLEHVLGRGNADLFRLPPLPLEISVRQGDRKFTCRGRSGLPEDDFYYPVRFVESGRFLQRVALENLEFADGAGERFVHKGWLEIALWPDRATLSVGLLTTNDPPEGMIEVAVGERRASAPLSAPRMVVLELFGPRNSQASVIDTDGPMQLGHDEGLGCAILTLPHQKWVNAKGTAYPEEELDRLDRWRFTARNDTDRESTLPIMFIDTRPPAITGFTPMLCDADGTPTGIPVQISKNWHRRPEKGDLRHQGPWFHGCTFIRLPPRTQRDFCFSIAYARYGGVPAASHAQLSLIGWGHNQFWDEAAIGSFGENICYEPGRLQRRCSIDDIRPLMTVSSLDSRRYGWAANCGGGDFLVWVDDSGRYRGFRQTRCNYRAYGPCLTEVGYTEETSGGEIAAQMQVSIARSDDYLRAFHHIRYDVRQPVKWQRLAFYQLGADRYNDTPARRVAIGDLGGLREEWQPIRALQAYDRQGVALTGEQPWISIHGLEREAVLHGSAFASRGLIVRSWRAVLGGKTCRQPYAAFFATEQYKGIPRTVVELSTPPGLETLRPGDYVEADLELVAFPADPPAYYGPNQPFRQALTAGADSWRLVQREAQGNALQVAAKTGKVTRNYPLVVTADGKGRARCDVTGGIGYVPMTFTGLKHYRDFELLVDGKAVNQSVHGNDFWQTDYDAVQGRWQLTYNLLRDGGGPIRLELRAREGR